MPARKQEIPPSGMCAYQLKVEDGVWRCFTEQEYLQRKINENVIREACIASRPMPAYPNLTNGIGALLLFSIVFAFFYCIENQKWLGGSLVIFGMLSVFIFLKPFC